MTKTASTSGQTTIGTQHQAPGRTDADKSEFTAYGTSEDKHELSDITSMKGAPRRTDGAGRLTDAAAPRARGPRGPSSPTSVCA
ncbi:hypothetical protein AB7952_02370 [Streptomyces sp. PG2]